MGWVAGEQVVFFGKRELEPLHFRPYDNGLLSDVLNVEILHEEVFWLDANGNVNSLGFGPEGIRSDLRKNWKITDYSFTYPKFRVKASINIESFLRSMPPAMRTTRGTRAMPWIGIHYDVGGLNCQDFGSAADNAFRKLAGGAR
jgi:hypothetical protein